MKMLLLFLSTHLLYVGPGMSGGIIGAIWGILSAFFISIIVIFWYPLKKFYLFIRSFLKKPK
jgi:hypothetical protein